MNLSFQMEATNRAHVHKDTAEPAHSNVATQTVHLQQQFGMLKNNGNFRTVTILI